MKKIVQKIPLQVYIFTFISLFFSTLGIYLAQVQAVEGAELLFLCTPFLLAAVFSFRNPDLKFAKSLRVLNLRYSWRWYLFALLIYAFGFFFITMFAQAFGLITTTNWSSYPSMVLLALPSAFIFSFFEEFAWRGYLEPLFLSKGLSQRLSSFFTGLIWVAWHIPLFAFAYYDIYSSYPIRSFILFGLTLMVTAQVYGIMRSSSQSVWTSVLMHASANAFALPLLVGDKAIWSDYKLEWLILPSPNSVLSLVFWLAVFVVILWLRKSRLKQQNLPLSS